MSEGLVWMSERELDRLGVARDAAEGRIRQRQAAERLGLGIRQLKRLVRRYRERGAAGLVWLRRAFGFEASREAVEQRDCAGGPQAGHGLGSRALCGLRPDVRSGNASEVHGFSLSAETLRKWMVEDGPRRVEWCRSARGVPAVRASASWFRSTVRSMPGSRAAGRGARCSCSSTMRPVGFWRCASLRRRPRRRA